MNNSRHKVRICVPICALRIDDVLADIHAAKSIADLVEVRLDCLDETESGNASSKLTEHSGLPLILTLRPEEQGGKKQLSIGQRQEFWNNLSTGDFLIDLEFDLASSLKDLDWTRVICSYHDFNGVPDDLNQIYERMSATPARILKIAVTANDVADCLPVFRLLESARRENRELIAIAMGDAGVVTRVLGPSRGSYLTYGPLKGERATAPGQLTAQDLRELYRVDSITSNTIVTGLIGLPISHSFSPYIHNAALAAEGIDGVYLPFPVRDLTQFMRRMVKPSTREMDWRLRGLSVTAPYKSAVIEWLDWVEPAVEEIGAANTIVVEDGSLRGYNTDAAAFVAPLITRLGPLAGLKCAVLGAGGAARTAVWALRREGANVTVFARDMVRGSAVAKRYGVEIRELRSRSFAGFDVVVNTTPLGTAGSLQSQSVIDSSQLYGAGLAYDLVYNPIETELLREAARAGCQSLGGLEMLVTQAAAQFELWTRQGAPVEAMNKAAELAIKRFS